MVRGYMYDSILGQMSLEAHAIYLYHSNNQSKYCNNNNTAIILSILFETHTLKSITDHVTACMF